MLGNQDYKPAPSVCSTDSTSVNTPTHTIISDGAKEERDIAVASAIPSLPPFTIDGGISSVPEPGGKYMIRDLDSGKAITLVDGRLTLVLDAGTRGGWQWQCEELADGWIGFRETVSAKYLGRDNKGGFRAEAGRLDSWESFVLRPREAGGFNLWAKHWFMLKAMAILEDSATSPKLVEARTAQEAARWEFVKVG